MKNLFILGPVGSGKNTLMNKIVENSDVVALDTGQIFRYVCYCIYEKLKHLINFDKVRNKDEEEINNLKNEIFHLTNYYTEKLSKLTFDSSGLYYNNKKIENEVLYQRETNMLLPIICNLKVVRKKIINYIDEKISVDEKPVIMTGHSIKDIDTSKFIIVFLDVDKKQSSYRIFNRDRNSYNDIIDAYDEVETRNSCDNIEFTKRNLTYLYNCIYIDTTNKNVDEVYSEFINKQIEIQNNYKNFEILQKDSIPRENFEWIFNIALLPIKQYLENILTEEFIFKYPFINKNDLIYQCLILTTFYNLNEIYESEIDLSHINDIIKNRKNISLDQMIHYMNLNSIKINKQLISKIINDSLIKLLKLYEECSEIDIMKKYNQNTKNKEFKVSSHSGLVIKDNNGNGVGEITYRKLDLETSNFISKYCHYLHTPRDDEYVSYGAFLENEEYPIAYVSFSKQDREYKKELLYNLGIEPQNTLEMTRAWCANYAPSNIMSSLFQYSIDEISKEWKEKSKERKEDKYLQAITTAINPNLGFNASSFLGCNFFPIALRPAKYTFVENNGVVEYCTRRKINDGNYSVTSENNFEILPLNELIHCVDKQKEKNIKNSNILLINKNNYNKVLDRIRK